MSIGRLALASAVVAAALAFGCGDGDGTPADAGVDSGTGEGSGATPSPRESAPNACGGTVALTAAPGDVCGPCLDGTYVCDGGDSLRCLGAVAQVNACGTCEALDGAPGDPCGCSGTLGCDGPALVCYDAVTRNACGGCEPLGEGVRVGHTCEGGAGITACTGPNEVACRTAGANLCGRGGVVQAIDPVVDGQLPGDACGACGLGTVICDGNTLRCDGAEAGVNACGTCAPLVVAPGSACGCGGSGTWVCDADRPHGVRCEGADAPNACGGCGALAGLPGDACDDGVYVCAGPDALACEREGRMACGTAAFPGPRVGEACGSCRDGAMVCVAPDASACVGAAQPNVCGGCGPLAGEPGQYCAPGRVWSCTDEGIVACVQQRSTNACGGVGALSARPGEPCGSCGDGVYICISDEDVACFSDSAPNACGGCGALDGVPGRPCGVCNTGRWACDGPESVRCAGEYEDARFLHYEDLDGDGFGVSDRSAEVCPGTPRYARRSGDCDDAYADVYPRARELCDGRDNDCDDAIDEDFVRWRDFDGDGFGEPGSEVVACEVADEFVDNDDDCYDRNPDVFPGQVAFFDRHRGDGSWDFNCDESEELAFDVIGQCGLPPFTCNYVPSGMREGWLDTIIPCGEEGAFLFDCLPDDDGCRPNVDPGLLQVCR